MQSLNTNNKEAQNTIKQLNYVRCSNKLTQSKDSLPDGVRLIAISKYHPNEYIEAAYNEGQRMFGEKPRTGAFR